MANLLFTPGIVTATPPALDLIERLGLDVATLLARHTCGDYGEVDGLGALANRETLEEGVGTILSVYDVGDAEKLWVTTTIPQGDERYTVLMLRSDW
jgi:hypothetical protein